MLASLTGFNLRDQARKAPLAKGLGDFLLPSWLKHLCIGAVQTQHLNRPLLSMQTCVTEAQSSMDLLLPPMLCLQQVLLPTVPTLLLFFHRALLCLKGEGSPYVVVTQDVECVLQKRKTHFNSADFNHQNSLCRFFSELHFYNQIQCVIMET